MNCKMLTITAIIILMFTAGCTLFNRVVYHPDINQGNYFTADDIEKIHIGMTKQEVVCILGTSIMKNPFSSNIWYYIFRREPSRGYITQQTLTLIFNNSNTLIHIENKSMSKGSKHTL